MTCSRAGLCWRLILQPIVDRVSMHREYVGWYVVELDGYRLWRERKLRRMVLSSVHDVHDECEWCKVQDDVVLVRFGARVWRCTWGFFYPKFKQQCSETWSMALHYRWNRMFSNKTAKLQIFMNQTSWIFFLGVRDDAFCILSRVRHPVDEVWSTP